MKVYTLFYKNSGLYNRSLFVMHNDITAKEAMKLNLKQADAERFRNQVALGDTILKCIGTFNEDSGMTIQENEPYDVCNLKELLDDNTGNMENVKSNNT